MMHSFELWLGWVGGYITCRRIFCVEVSICYHGLEEFRFNTLVVFECLSQFVSFNKYYIRVQIPNQSPPLNRTLPIHPYDTAMVSPSRSEIDISVCTPNYATLSTSQFPNLLYNGWYSRQHHQQGSEYRKTQTTQCRSPGVRSK